MTNTTNAGPVLPVVPYWLTRFDTKAAEAYGLQCWNAAIEQVAGPLREEVKALRRLLFHVYTGPVLGYTDNGELQDGTAHPAIDFVRQTPEQIAQAIDRREGKGGRGGELRARIAVLEAALGQGLEIVRAENEALRKFLDEYRRAAIACMKTVTQTRGCDGMDGLANANDRARELLASIDAARAAREG